MTDQLIAGRYRVLSPPLQGGQATVVEAFDERHDRKVALKISTIDDESGAALLAETRVLLDLRAHPGLPIVRDDDFLGDQYIVVMDWVEGTDLGQLLRQRGTPGLSRSSVVDYIVQAAAALDHLHAHEPPVIHGDVKPSNLILTPEGRIVLVDFGIARTGPGGRSLGSRGFGAPEVAAGGPVTPAADVYGLAATAVTLLTGHSPGQAGLDLAELNLDDVGPMARALRRALSTNPTKRPASAGELAEGLRAGHRAPPTGVVTLMATENVGTGERWDDDPEAMDQMSQRLDDLVFEVVDSRDGMLVTSSAYGERTLSLFRQPSSAAATAFALHQAILDEPWPGGIVPQLRIGLHSGESGLHDGSYSATMLNRVGRLRSLAPPGRTVLSAATAQLMESRLPDGARLAPLSVPGSTGEGPVELLFGLTGADDFEPFELETKDAGPVAPPMAEVGRLQACIQEHRTAFELVRHLVGLAERQREHDNLVPSTELRELASILAARATRLKTDIGELQAQGH